MTTETSDLELEMRRHDQDRLIEETTQGLMEYLTNDQGFLNRIQAITVNSFDGWEPTTEEDESDPRYDLWWACYSSTTMMILNKVSSKLFYPAVIPNGRKVST